MSPHAPLPISQVQTGPESATSMAFAGSEITMQVIGYALGAGAGQMLGDFAAYMGFAPLAFIGFVMIRKSFRHFSEATFDATRGMGLLLTPYRSALIPSASASRFPQLRYRLWR
jgi:putative Mn2+ efflux pump MntP